MATLTFISYDQHGHGGDVNITATLSTSAPSTLLHAQLCRYYTIALNDKLCIRFRLYRSYHLSKNNNPPTTSSSSCIRLVNTLKYVHKLLLDVQTVTAGFASSNTYTPIDLSMSITLLIIKWRWMLRVIESLTSIRWSSLLDVDMIMM